MEEELPDIKILRDLKEFLLSTDCFEDNGWLDKYCSLIETNKKPT